VPIRGFAQNIDASDGCGVIWALKGEYPFPAAPVTLEVLSDSADDTSAGTGVRTILIQGLDENWDAQSVFVTMNGVTPVAATGSWMRVNTTVAFAAGSGGRNAGTIATRVASAGDTLSLIPVVHGRGLSISQDAVYTVPADHLFYITDAVIDSQDLIGSMTYNAEFRNNALPNPAWVAGAIFSANEGGVTTTLLHIIPGIVITGKTDLQLVTMKSTSPVFSDFSFLGQGVLVSPGYF